MSDFWKNSEYATTFAVMTGVCVFVFCLCCYLHDKVKADQTDGTEEVEERPESTNHENISSQHVCSTSNNSLRLDVHRGSYSVNVSQRQTPNSSPNHQRTANRTHTRHIHNSRSSDSDSSQAHNNFLTRSYRDLDSRWHSNSSDATYPSSVRNTEWVPTAPLIPQFRINYSSQSQVYEDPPPSYESVVYSANYQNSFEMR